MVSKKLVLIGGGGHCKSVLETVINLKKYEEIVITDPLLSKGENVLGCKVVGNDDVLPELLKMGFTNAIITVGSILNVSLRKRLTEMVSALGFSFPVIADPSAIISEHVHIGAGTFIGKNAVINTDAVIGEHCIINTGAIIEHECIVEDFNHISVGAILCGRVCVSKESFIGAGATVIQGKRIGINSVVGAGAVVNEDLPDKCTAVGVPVKVIKVMNH